MHASHLTKRSHVDQGRRAGARPCSVLPFLFGAKGASAGKSIKQRHPFRCNKTKTSRTAGWKSSWSPSRRHHQSLWQARTNFIQDKCTRCSPSKWPIVGALPAQYLGRGPGPLPINRTSHSKGRGSTSSTGRTLARTTNARTPPLARLFFLVLFIISLRGNPPHTHWSRVLHHNGGLNQYKSCVSCVASSLS